MERLANTAEQHGDLFVVVITITGVVEVIVLGIRELGKK